MAPLKVATKIAFVALAAYAVLTATAGAAVPTATDWTSHYRQSTVSLGVPDATGSFVQQCTGVIVALRPQYGFIVTATHCIPPTSIRELRVRFAWNSEDDPGVILHLYDNAGRPTAQILDAGSDVAAVSLAHLDSVQLPVGVTLQGIGPSDFATPQDLYDGSEVFIYGFPGVPGTAARAITRHGVVAWTDPKASWTRPFLVDAALLPGNSGGPVFRVQSGLTQSGAFEIGNHVVLMGIVSQTYTTSMRSPVSPPHMIEVLTSIGQIRPISAIQSLVDKLTPKQ